MAVDELQVLKNARAKYFKIEKAKKINTNSEVLEEYDNWYYYNFCYYYYKKRTTILSLLNELLGEELSLYFHLPTVRYKVASENGNISGLVSKDIKNKKLEYHYATELPPEQFVHIDNMLTFNSPGDPLLKEQLTAYMFRGLYSALRDRYNNAIYATDADHPFILPPSLDYESAFIDPFKHTYQDPIMLVSLTYIQEIKRNNPYYDKYLKMTEDLDIEKLLHNVSKKKKILIPEHAIEYYHQFDSDRKTYLKGAGLN